MPTSFNTQCLIWQIFFQPNQLKSLDPDFIPFDNSGQTSNTYEFAVFQRLSLSHQTDNCHWGAVSWKFTEKTGLSGKELKTTIAHYPVVDVFYTNPFPHVEALYTSPWWNGETSHPDFVNVVTQFFQAAGWNTDPIHKITPAKQYSMCNYFVGNAKFWKLYLPFVEKSLALAEENMPANWLAKMHSTEADHRNLHQGATYVPFIVERLFTTFLQTQGRQLKTHKIPSPTGEKQMNTDLRELRQMKDMAIMTKSTKILNIWQEKRKEYFLKTHSKYWCDRYLDSIMSAPVVW